MRMIRESVLSLDGQVSPRKSEPRSVEGRDRAPKIHDGTSTAVDLHVEPGSKGRLDTASSDTSVEDVRSWNFCRAVLRDLL